MALRICLLGQPKVHFQESVFDLLPDRRSELIAYLALAGDWVERTRLALLLWPDTEREAARQNLRQLLVRVKRFPFTEALEADPERIRWPVESDVAEFKQHLRKQAWEAAVSIYGGRLLSGLEADHSPEFAAWLELERQTLHSGWRTASLQLARYKQETGAYAQALALLHPLLQADELDEEALQLFLNCAALAGERQEALNRYEQFRQKLKGEMGLEPLAPTIALAKAIQTGELGTPTEEPIATLHKLPTPLTPFIGRDLEREEIARMLSDPACRLLTLLGPGGIGKTRLAVQAARELTPQYEDGVGFVPLVSLNDPALIPVAVLAALDLPLVGQVGPQEQLVGFLRKRRFLLVLDNLEHLLPSLGLLERLLENCPNLQILTTSRERLGLAGEWVVEVGGMLLPPSGSEEGAEGFEAVQLFVRSAQRTERGFSLKAENHSAIVRICRLVGGSPLGLELAASWVRLLPCEAIAAELAQSLDFVEGALPELPERHRSLRRVFEHSWKRLSTQEQNALAKLSVFQSGFSVEAAEAVAGVSRRSLLSLLDRSLVQRSGERLNLHELVRQYAAEKLNHDPEVNAQTVEAHGKYYTRLYGQLGLEIWHGATPMAALQIIAEEMDNIRAAWNWACQTRNKEALFRAAEGQWYIYFTEAREEGWDMNRRALDSLPAGCVERVKLLGLHARLALRTGKTNEALELVEESLRLGHKLGIPEDLATLENLGGCLLVKGNVEGAKAAYQMMLDQATYQADSWNIWRSLSALAGVAGVQHDHMLQEAYFQHALEQAHTLGNPLAIADTLEFKSSLYINQHRWQEAIETLEAALLLTKDFPMNPAPKFTSISIGECYMMLGKSEEARPHLVFGLEAFQKVVEEQGRNDIYILRSMGKASFYLGLHQQSLDYYTQALRSIWVNQEILRAPEVMYRISILLQSLGQPTTALLLVGFIHQSNWPIWPIPLERQQVILNLKAELSAIQPDSQAILERGAQMSLEEVVRLLEQYTPAAVS